MKTTKELDDENVNRCGYFRNSNFLMVLSGFTVVFVNSLQSQVLPPILPYIISSFSDRCSTNDSMKCVKDLSVADKERVAWTISIDAALAIPVAIFGGYILEKLTRKWTLFSCLFLGSIFIVSAAFCRHYQLFVVVCALSGVMFELAYLTALAVVSSQTDDMNYRAKVLAIVMVAKNIGYVLGPSMASFLYVNFGKEAPFIMIALLAMCSIPCGMLSTRYGGRRNDVRSDELDPTTTQQYKLAFTDGYIIVLLLVLCVNNCVNYSQSVVEPQHLEEDLGVSLKEMGYFALIGVWWQTAATVLASLDSPIIPARWSILMAGMVTTSISFYIYSVCNSMWDCVGAEVLFRVGMGLINFVLPALLTMLAHHRHGGRTDVLFSLYATFEALGEFIGPFLSALAIGEERLPTILLYTGMTELAFAVLSLVFRKPESESEKSTSSQKGEEFELLSN
ncbi:chromaffin granule amine transporter-like [Tubulanus polymorphus]|uniref:chromaffin granule amine transporter-like n=1 Tax=Tubulanus polymorphus TaxID=672921 RepID=UPI003DA23B9D